MSNNQFKIIFKGELLPGFAVTDVKKSLKQRFSIDENKLEQLFSGSTVMIKKNMTIEDALKYHEKCKSLGLITYIQEETIEINKATIATKSSSNTIKTSSSFSQEKINDDINAVIEPPSILGLDFSSGLKLSRRFNCRGRYGRINFFNAYWIISIVSFAIDLVINFIPRLLQTQLVWALGTFKLIIAIIVFILTLRIIILRLHDINLSAWWLPLFVPWFFILIMLMLMSNLGMNLPILLSSLPKWLQWLSIIIMLLATFSLLIIPGTQGKNRYGLPVRQGNLLVFYIALFLSLLPYLFILYLAYSFYRVG